MSMSAQSKDVIVSFCSKGRENYCGQMLRLIDSVKEHWKGDMLVYSPDHHLSEYKGITIHKGWPQPKGLKNYTHSEMPYQFKTSMIQLALEQGYERIIWLDSSMQLKKDLTPLFDSEWGITTFENLGHPTWKYLKDSRHWDSMGEKRIKNIPQIWGGAFAFNFQTINAPLYFDIIKEYSMNGTFKDGVSSRAGFVAHRHDQSVMSLILHERCTMLPYGQILCPPHDTTGEYGRDPYLICRGL